MKKINFIKNCIGFLILLIFCISCSSELDFDQANDLKLEPVIVGNLAYFDQKATDFVDNGSGTILFDVQDFSPFRDAFLRENLNKTELYFEVENTIDRNFTVSLYFLDRNNQILYEIPIAVPASNGTPVTVTKTEIFEGQKLESIQQMTQVEFVLKMDSETPLTADSIGSLKLRSSATLYLEIE